MPKVSFFGILMLLLICWLSPNVLDAQTGKQLFKGRINDLNDIDLDLRFTGTQIEGRMRFLRSATELDLKGTKKGTEWYLEESKNGIISGLIEGQFENGVFSGEWFNIDRSLSAAIAFERTTKQSAFASRCGDNKWARVFNGTVGEEKATLILQKNCLNDLVGTIQFRETVFDLKGSFSGNKTASKNLKVESTLRDLNGQKRGFFDGILEGNRKLSGWLTKKGKREAFAFEYKEEMAVGCKVFMDYMTAFDLLFPKSRETKLNEAILAKASEWQTEAYRYMDSLRRMQFDLVPEWRHQARAYGGYHLAKADEKIVSGYMQISNSWGGQEFIWTFNYDVKNKQLVDWTNQFKRRFDYKSFFGNKIKEGKKQLPLNRNVAFEKWLEKQAFEQYFLRADGIIFISDFHPIFGIQKIKVRYDALKGKWKRKSIFKKMKG